MRMGNRLKWLSEFKEKKMNAERLHAIALVLNQERIMPHKWKKENITMYGGIILDPGLQPK
jgi:hypothetical protein